MRSYLPDPDEGRVVLLLGPSMDVPGVLPIPCRLLTLPPALVPVVPCIPVVDEAEPVPLPDSPAELPDVPADDPLPEPPPELPPLCATAKLEMRARIDASAIVESFIRFPFMV